MNRRNFIRTGSVASLAIGPLALASCNTSPEPEKKPVAETTPATFTDSFELNEFTVDQLQEKMKQGQYTSKSITDMYLKRIAAIDKDGPTLNAIIELNPDAFSIAGKM